MSGIEKFSEEKLPAKEAFYSKLNDCGVSDEDYDHAKNVWKEFEVKNMGEYHDLYLNSDVLLLADVLKNSEMFAWKIILSILLGIILLQDYLGMHC